jgi:hypothetical protein
MDLSKLSDNDLQALHSGDLTKVSDEGLKYLHEQNQPPSSVEALGRGALQGATLGYADEATGAGEAMLNKLMGSHKKLMELYEQHRDEARANNEAARAAHPAMYLGGQIGGGAATALAGPAALAGKGLAGGAAVGALAGYGNSDANNIGGAVADTATGAAFGGLVGGALKAIPSIKSGDTAERMAINSLNASPEESGAMLKAVGQPNRESVGRTLLKNKILGRLGLNSDNSVAEALQKTSDRLGIEQSALVNDLGDAKVHMSDIRKNVSGKLDVPASIEGNTANNRVEQQIGVISPKKTIQVPQSNQSSILDASGNPVIKTSMVDQTVSDPNATVSLPRLMEIKKQWQGLSDYPSAGAVTPQDISNSGAMKNATSGLRQTIGQAAPELNPILREESNVFQARDAMGQKSSLGHATGILPMAYNMGKSFGNQVGAVTADSISKVLQSSPQSLGKFAGPLAQAYQRSPESLKATLHVLQLTNPEFRQMTNPTDDSNSSQP